MTNSIFIDASFWIAYRDENQLNHVLAKQGLSDSFKQRVHFTTTLPVICEIHASFSRKSRIRGQILEDFWNNPLVKIEDVSLKDESAAIEILRRNSDKTYSLCDALSFVVMRRLNIPRALTFDRHFRQFGGFDILPGKIT